MVELAILVSLAHEGIKPHRTRVNCRPELLGGLLGSKAPKDGIVGRCPGRYLSPASNSKFSPPLVNTAHRPAELCSGVFGRKLPHDCLFRWRPGQVNLPTRHTERHSPLID